MIEATWKLAGRSPRAEVLAKLLGLDPRTVTELSLTRFVGGHVRLEAVIQRGLTQEEIDAVDNLS